MITRAHVMPYVGQRVVVRTRDGAIHHGILHSVVDDGIYMRPLRARLASGEAAASAAVQLGNLPAADTDDIAQTWWPFLFFPWLFIGAFWPWAWWW